MNNSSRLIGTVVVVAVVGIGLAVVLNKKKTTTPSSSSSPSSSVDNSAVAIADVTIQGYAFAPAAITVKAGSKVTWTNQDAVRHTVTSDTKGNGPDSQLFGRGETYSYTFDKPGTYTYYCMPHPYMKGSVVVTQ